jgi:hypothetical protein
MPLGLNSIAASLSRNDSEAQIPLTALGVGFNYVTEFRLEPSGGDLADAIIADDLEEAPR